MVAHQAGSDQSVNKGYIMANGKFYTYIHRKADTGEVFYIGKGKGQRSHTIYNRTKFWRHVVAKHGFVVELVEFFDNESDALSSEIVMIADYRLRGIPLVNLTIGGEGASGQVFTEERKRKISEALKGKEVPQSVREKISQSLKGRKHPPRSDDHRRHLSECQKGKTLSEDHIAALCAAWVIRKANQQTVQI